MKKRELLTMKDYTVTDKMIKVVREDREQRYFLFFHAAVENNILKISVFPKKWILAEKKNPQFEIYISRKDNDFISYEVEACKWRTAKIDMLNFIGNTYSVRGKENYECGNSRKIVNEYLGTGNLGIKNAVLEFQYGVRKENLKKKYRSELEQIDSVMNEVPDLPKDFNKWVERNCFTEYLMYKKKGMHYEVFCTHCNQWVKVKDKPVHNMESQCPNCNTPAVYKSWNKQKGLDEVISVGIIQRLRDDTAYVLRRFNFSIERRLKYGWDTCQTYRHECVRTTLDKNFRQDECFEFGEYRYTGVRRWCYEVRGAFGYRERLYGRVRMYTPNMKKVLSKESFAKCDLKKMFYGGERKAVGPLVILQVLNRYPYLEYLQKSSLHRLVEEILCRDERPGLFENDASKIHQVLKLNKQNFKRMQEVDGDCNVLEVLQWVQCHNEKISNDNLLLIRDKGIRLGYLQVDRTSLTVERAVNLLKSQAEKMKVELEDAWTTYRDYLDMAERRGMDITDEIVCKNNRMVEYHDRYLEEENGKKNADRDAEVDEKYKEIEMDYKQNTMHFSFETEDYIIKAPEKASDITKEGRFQHHCVGASDGYLAKMVKGTTYILFLRKKCMEDRPYYTLEVKHDGEILQKRSMYNRQPNIEKINEVLTMWQKEIEKRCMEEQKAAV